MTKSHPPHVNPAAVVFILFCVAMGALLGNAWAGLAAGAGLSFAASVLP